MASQDEVRLGRLVVQRRLATEEQVLDALRARNAKPEGPDLGAILVARGFVSEPELAKLRTGSFDHHEASTDHEISIQGTREVIARDQLEEALRAAKAQPRVAHKELLRLAREFRDTESGVRAEREARSLEAANPELRRK